MAILTLRADNLTKAQYFEKHLMILGPFLPAVLHPKEREVLALFMSFEGELAKVDRFNTFYRKQVKAALKMSDGGLTNHITSLRNKAFVYEGLTGLLEIKEFLFPDPKVQKYQILITEQK